MITGAMEIRFPINNLRGRDVIVSLMIAASVLSGFAAAAGGPSVSVDKTQYVVGEEVRIEWSHPPKPEGQTFPRDWRLCVMPVSSKMLAEGIENLPYQSAAQDYREAVNGRGIYVFRPEWYVELAKERQQYIAAVVDKSEGYKSYAQTVFTVSVPEIPYRSGHMKIIGQKGAYIDFRMVEVMEVETTALGPEDEIGLYRPAKRIGRNAVLPGDYVSKTKLTQGQRLVQIELPYRNPRYGPPGEDRYELHYLYEGRYVIDAATIDVERFEHRLQASLSTYDYGAEALEVLVEMPKTREEMGEGATHVILLKPAAEGMLQLDSAEVELRERSSTISDEDCQELPSFCFQRVLLSAPTEVGDYIVQLVQKGRVFGSERFEVTREALDIAAKKAAENRRIYGGGIREIDVSVEVGRAIGHEREVSVSVEVPKARSRNSYLVEREPNVRYRGPDEKDGDIWLLTLDDSDGDTRNPEDTERITIWTLERGVPFEEKIKLGLGQYVFRVECVHEGDEAGRRVHDFASFNVGFPIHGAKLEIETPEPYSAEKQLTGRIQVAEDLLSRVKPEKFAIIVVDPLEARPSCFLPLVGPPPKTRVEDDYSVPVRTPSLPGDYVVRLYYSMDQRSNYVLINESPLEVSLPDATLRLLSPEELHVGDTPRARVEVIGFSPSEGTYPAGFRYKVNFETAGFIVPGGAKAFRVEHDTYNLGGKDLRTAADVEAVIEGRKAEAPGLYYARLYYGPYVISSIPFTVVDPEDPDYASMRISMRDVAPSHLAPAIPLRAGGMERAITCPGFESLEVPDSNETWRVRLAVLGPGGDDLRPIDAIEGINPFRVELRYREPPETAPASVSVGALDGITHIAIEATNSPRVFRTGWHSLEPAAERYFREVEGLNVPSPEDSARIAAELFKGRWYVSNSGGEFDGALGVSLVADSGAAARLCLKAGETERRYDAFEMLATKDASGGRHTLDVRFEEYRVEDHAAAQDVPESRVLYVDEGTESLTFAAGGERLEVPVTLPESRAERIRVSLTSREGDGQLSGKWSKELASGDLGGGGQQTWSRGSEIIDVIPLEEQRPRIAKPEPISVAQVGETSSATLAELMPRRNADIDMSTTYPFEPDEADQPDLPRARVDPRAIRHRTLFVYGHNLPQNAADAIVFDSADELITYTLEHLPGEGADALFAKGWAKAQERTKEPLGPPSGYTALVLKAKFVEGIKPGIKMIGINGAAGLWHLDFSNANAGFSFARHFWQEDADTNEAEFQATEVLCASEVAYVVLNESFPLPHKGLRLKLLKNGEAVARFEAKRFGTPSNAEYRSPPLRLCDVNRRFGSPPHIENAIDVNVSPGDELTAKLENPTLIRTFPAQAVAKIIDKPSDLGDTWKKALARTAACYEQSGIDFETMSREEADEFSRFIFTENIPAIFSPPMWAFMKSRSIKISKGDQAAAILIRDEFVKMMQAEIPRMRAEMVDEEKAWQFFLEARTSPLAFWDISKVAGPKDQIWSLKDVVDLVMPIAKITGATAGWEDITLHDPHERTLREVVEHMIDYREQFGLTPQEAHMAAYQTMRMAYFQMLDLAEGALARAQAAGDCNCTELLLIGGQEADNVVARIMPRLVRLADDGERQYWVPDLVAQGYVKSLKHKGAAMHALELYGRIDDAYKAMAIAAATAGTGFVLSAGGYTAAGAAVVLAGDVVDMGYFGGMGVNQYIEGEALMDYAEGAALVMGGRFYQEAEALKTEWWEAAMGVLLPGVSGASNLRQLNNIRRTSRGARILSELDNLSPAALARLSGDELLDLGAYFTDLNRRRPGSLWRNIGNIGENLSQKELADLRRFDDFLSASGVPAVPNKVPVGRLIADSEDVGKIEIRNPRVDSDVDIETIRADADTVIDIQPGKRTGPEAEVETVRGDAETIRDPEPGRRTGPEAEAETVRADAETVPNVEPGRRTGPEVEVETVRGDAETIRDPEPSRRTGTEAEAETVRADAETVPNVEPGRRTGPEAEAETMRADAETIPDPEPGKRTGPDAEASTLRNDPEAETIRSDGPRDIAAERTESVEMTGAERTALRKRLKSLTPGRVSINNGETQFSFGEFLGDGRTTTVTADADDPTKAFRIMRKGFDPGDILMDDFGYRRASALEDGSDGLFQVTKQHGQWRITNVSDPRFQDLEGAIITRVERVDMDAAKRVRNQPGGITRGQLHAFDQTTRYFNRHGVAWTDNHFGNFDFVPVDEARDIWRIEIFDTGGFFPTVGNNVFEQYRNARAIQEAFNIPDEDWVRAWRAAQAMPNGPARNKVISMLRDKRIGATFDVAWDRVDFRQVFGDERGGMIGSPMGMVDRDSYRSLASQPPGVADELSLRHTSRQTPVSAPQDPRLGPESTAGRRPTPAEIDEIEKRLFDNSDASPRTDFRDRTTEPLTVYGDRTPPNVAESTVTTAGDEAKEPFLEAHRAREKQLRFVADDKELGRSGSNGTLRFEHGSGAVPAEVALADHIGAGAFNEVFHNARDAKSVVRVSRFTGDHKSILLEADGRKGLQEAARLKPDDIAVPRQHNVYRNIRSDDPRLNGKTIEIVDYVDEPRASDLFRNNPDGQPTPEQAYAYARGVTALNGRGYVLLDAHGGNYTIGKHPKTGKPLLFVLDPGAVVRARGNSLAERIANARKAQEAIDIPNAELEAVWGRFSMEGDNRWIVKQATLSEEVLGGLIELEAYGLRYAEQIPMTPVGAEPYPRIRELLRLLPDEAAKQFEEMQQEYLRNLPDDGGDVPPVSCSQPGGRLIRLTMSLEKSCQWQTMCFNAKAA